MHRRSLTWARPENFSCRERCGPMSGEALAPELLLGAHDVKDEHLPAILAIKDAAGWLDDLSIAAAGQFRRARSTGREPPQLFHMFEHALDQRPRRVRVLNGDVVRDGVKIAERRLGPDYFSHRAIRALALLWVTTRPCSMARSPRAMPSRTTTRRCSFS